MVGPTTTQEGNEMARVYKAEGQAATREEWLHSAIDALRPRFEEISFPLPEKIHVSVGFGYGRARAESKYILAQCWATFASKDGVNQIFISPVLGTADDALAALIHELVHAADDCVHGHQDAFADAAKALGLEGPMTQALPGVVLSAELATLAEALGQYPHAPLELEFAEEKEPAKKGAKVPAGAGAPAHSGPKKQTARMLKVQCKTDDCVCGGYTVRTTSKWLEIGYPWCPGGNQMVDA
jgi:hypothetical protein